MTSLDFQGEFINYEPICEWVSTCTCIFIKILWVIKYTIYYGPIHEWALASAKLFMLGLDGTKMPAHPLPFGGSCAPDCAEGNNFARNDFLNWKILNKLQQSTIHIHYTKADFNNTVLPSVLTTYNVGGKNCLLLSKS